MKTIFTHKADHKEKTVEPTTQETQTTDLRLRNALAEVQKYLADNFGTQPSALTYKEYTNGISLTSDDTTFSTAVVFLTRSHGTYNLPDNVILLGYVETDKDNDFILEHLSNFIKYLMKLGTTHGIQHLAIAFSKEHYDYPNIIQSADVTCLRLY